MGQLPFERFERKVIVRREAKTSPNYGCRPEERQTEQLINYGIVNVDKPKGPTSHQVSAYVQQILGIKKSGHSGTLDPGVTGVLPTALNEATKVVQLLLTAGKEYVALMHLHNDFSEEKVKEAMNSFVGRIMQLPPVKSAVKRQLRERNIYYIEPLEFKGRYVLFTVGCQAGVYIRRLIDDIGKKLGSGANMQELRRTKAGPFNEKTLSTLQDLSDAYYYYKKEDNDKLIRKVIQPVENAVAHLPKIWVLDSAVDSVCRGASLKLPGIVKLNSGIMSGDLAAVMTLKDELICYGVAGKDSKGMMGEKGLAVKTERVFMKPGTYMRIEKQLS